jgi:hypothetical protein
VALSSESQATGTIIVRPKRLYWATGGILLGWVAIGGGIRAYGAGNAFDMLIAAVVLGLPSVGCVATAWRAKPSLILDREGLTCCRTAVRLTWRQIASIEIRERQGTFDLYRDLVVTPVDESSVAQQWSKRRFRPEPEGGIIDVPVDHLSLDGERLIEAIEQQSGSRVLRPPARRRRWLRRPRGEAV